MLRTAHLFAGAGGGLLADLILGHKPVLAVEWDQSCCRSLRARVDEGWFPGLHIHCGDIREYDFSSWSGGVDCVSAGFPCQDISCAGSGKGLTGDRSGLVWEVFRAVDAIQPGLVFFENSPEIRKKGRRDIIRALVERGYTWRDGTLTAAAVGAGHKRDRWWLLAANADGHLKLGQERIEREKRGWIGDKDNEITDHFLCGQQEIRGGEGNGKNLVTDPDRAQALAANALLHRLQISIQCGGISVAGAATIEAAARYTTTCSWSPPDAGICGMVDGVAAQMDGCSKRARIKSCGNGQVPLAAAAAFLQLSR